MIAFTTEDFEYNRGCKAKILHSEKKDYFHQKSLTASFFEQYMAKIRWCLYARSDINAYHGAASGGGRSTSVDQSMQHTGRVFFIPEHAAYR